MNSNAKHVSEVVDRATMIEEIRSEIDLKKKSELLKEYVRGDVNLELLSQYLRDEVENSDSKAWRSFCKQIQKYLRQQFYKKHKVALLNSKANQLAESIPIRVGIGDKQKSNPIFGFHLLDDKTKHDWLDRAELQASVLRKLLKSHPEMVLLERNPQIFRRLQGVLEANGVAEDWEERIQERLTVQSEMDTTNPDVEEVSQQFHMQQSQVVHHWTRMALMASLVGVLYFSVFPGAENTFDRLILTWETYLRSTDNSNSKDMPAKPQVLQELSMVEFGEKRKRKIKLPSISTGRPVTKSNNTDTTEKLKLKSPIKQDLGNEELEKSKNVVKPDKKRISEVKELNDSPAKIDKSVQKAEDKDIKSNISIDSGKKELSVNRNERPKKLARLGHKFEGKKSAVTQPLIDPNEFIVKGPVELNLDSPDELKDLTIKGPVKIALPDDSVLGNLSFTESVMASEWSTTGILLLGREKGNRADTVIYAMIHHNPLSLRFLSLPRDTRVPIKHKGQIVNDKIGHALRWGGVESIRDAAQNMLGMKIDHYVTLDLKLFRELVDVVGGVEINIEKDLKYIDRAGGVNIDLKKGLHLLNGKDAEGYVRFRRDGKGDLGRIKRQQKFLAAFLSRLRNMSELSWENIQLLSGLPKFLSEVVQKSSTDLTVITVAQFLKSFISNPDVKVDFKRLGGSPKYLHAAGKESKRSYYISNNKQINEAVRWLTVKDISLNKKLALAK